MLAVQHSKSVCRILSLWLLAFAISVSSSAEELRPPNSTVHDGAKVLSTDVDPSHSDPAKANTRFHKTHAAMGTEFSIDLYATGEEDAEQIATLAFDEVDRIEALLSNYRASSELSRINREAPGGKVTTDPETFAFLERSTYWSRRSDGAFDITVGPLLKLWGFFGHAGRVPSRTELESAHEHVGWNHLILDRADRSVSFEGHRTLELDPGSIGKGSAVDSVVRLLREAGVTSAFISAGGSTLYGLGAPPGAAGWPVNIPDPRNNGMTVDSVLLRDMSLSTGACTEKYFTKDGHRYCHIFNPQTMQPVEGMLQTTVIDPSATDSDALSTVVFVLPPARSRLLLGALPHTRALIFTGVSNAPHCVAIKWPNDVCSLKGQDRSRNVLP